MKESRGRKVSIKDIIVTTRRDAMAIPLYLERRGNCS